MSDEIKPEPITASAWVTRTFIVCVNPVNPDDKMEFASFVEMNDKLFELKMLSEALKRMVSRRDKSLVRYDAQVKLLKEAIASSPVAQLKLKELEGKTSYEEVNPKAE